MLFLFFSLLISSGDIKYFVSGIQMVNNSLKDIAIVQLCIRGNTQCFRNN